MTMNRLGFILSIGGAREGLSGEWHAESPWDVRARQEADARLLVGWWPGEDSTAAS